MEIWFRVDVENPMSAILDGTKSQPDVYLETLFSSVISGGSVLSIQLRGLFLYN